MARKSHFTQFYEGITMKHTLIDKYINVHTYIHIRTV